ncbi:MAG: YIP1 family protein [Phycisphaerales bacterium]|nr:YIP1 family protein [Phycisphaerales bacterium]
MKCKSCDYPLWQIRARVCPECGAPFKPSDFEFVMNSVQFRCPHCEQPYYGTGPNGHLRPPSFVCIGCSRAISMDEMVLLPTEGVSEVLTLPGRNPWVERRGNTWVGAWFRTIGMAIESPRGIGRQTPPQSSATAAFGFAILTNLVYVALSGLWILVFPFFLLGGMAGGRGIGLFVVAAVFVAIVPVGLLLAALVVHATLRLTGPAERGLKGTCLAVWYASAANIPTAVPCLSSYIAPLGWVWWAIASGFAVHAMHRCKGWRAALAVALPSVILAVLTGAGLMYAVHGLNSLATRAAGIATPANVGRISAAAGVNIAQIGADIRRMGLANPPTLPRHAIEIMEANSGLSYADSPYLALSIVIGGQSVGSLPNLPAAQRKASVSAIAASLPNNVIAHRLGDYVFTYSGIDLVKAPGSVWTVIYWPDPDDSPLLAGRTFHAACLDGTVESFTTEESFEAGLKRQNERRRDAGLPVLPHPREVTHSKPATVD